MDRIVVASPVSKSPAIVRAFLDGLARLDPSGCVLEWMFVDDNADAESSLLLHEFLRTHRGEVLLPPPRDDSYDPDHAAHRWSLDLVDRVAAHKDRILARVLASGADAVLLVDADLVLHPLTLEVLRAAAVEIVSEVFWTTYDGAERELPNVWVTDHYTMFPQRGPSPPEAHVDAATNAFLARLRLPGVHPVGGLGACTLIRRAALEAGVRFASLPNLSWLGEDRHFCVRAAALGFPLWADTHVAPLHLYRSSDLARLDDQLVHEEALAVRWHVVRSARRAAEDACARAGAAMLTAEMREDLAARLEPGAELGMRALGNIVSKIVEHEDTMAVEVEVELLASDLTPPWQCRVKTDVTVARQRFQAEPLGRAQSHELLIPRRVPILLSMIVRNEADRHLREVLGRLAQVVDEAVIVDDASTDRTAELCRDLLAKIPHQVEVSSHSLFEREHELRALQWRLAIARKPTWILNLDADELFEDCAVELLPSIVRSATANLVGFRLFDMWDPERYRSDDLWTAHRRYWPMLARPRSHEPAVWRRSNQHCGRWPLSITRQPMEISALRIKHLGWMRQEDRAAKYERYQRLDPSGRDGSLAHYESILDPAPNLVSW